MTDELEPRLSGLDGERPLPAAVRERLETALLAAAAGEAAPVPRSETAEPATQGPVPLDIPRPLPPHLRSRLEGVLLGRRTAAARARARLTPAFVALAAVLVLTLASVGVVRTIGFGGGGRERDVTAAGPRSGVSAPGGEQTTGGNPESLAEEANSTSTSTALADQPGPRSARPAGPSSAVNPPGGSGGSAGREPGAPAHPTPGPQPPAATSGPAPPAGGSQPGSEPGTTAFGPTSPSSGSGDAGPPPPYAFPAAPAATSTASSDSAQASPQPGRAEGPQPVPASPPQSPATPPASSTTAWRLGIVGGDAAQESGFRAYIELLNRNGGVRGRTMELVPAGPGFSTDGVLATVNLSPRPIASASGAPGWAGGPVLETLTATEDLLTGRVFSFASPPERQGHLVADAVFPKVSPEATAVIYTALDGPLAGPVPRAIEAVLTKRGVKVVVTSYDPAKPPAGLVPADAAFLSLDTATARVWLDQAHRSGYSPRRGVAGIYSLFDPALLSDLSEGARVVSPYVVPAGDEGEAIRSGTGSSSAAALHGWATAKSLAVALWRSGASTPEAMQAALEGLAGYESGLAPPYETRPHTRSRTPEGVLYEARSGGFTIQGGFRRDPH